MSAEILNNFVNELRESGINVVIEETATPDLSEILATKCTASGWKCATCSGCKFWEYESLDN